jgi:hypothetical protein
VPRLRGKLVRRWQIVGFAEVCGSLVHEGLDTKPGRGLPFNCADYQRAYPAREHGCC